MKRSRIVIVDDEPDILFLLKYNLLPTGADVKTFSSSVEALNYISTYPPDLIISDWMMPEMDGIQLCQKIQKSPNICHIPIMMLTCKNQLENMYKAINAGADDFVSKPIKINDFLGRIDRLLNTQKQVG